MTERTIFKQASIEKVDKTRVLSPDSVVNDIQIYSQSLSILTRKSLVRETFLCAENYLRLKRIIA